MKAPLLSTRKSARSFSQGGFTLVELMIGLVLGLLTTLVISQVLVLSESKKRTLTMGGDAQVNGALSLFSIQRDLQMSGYGASASPDALGCTVKGQFDTTGSAFSFTLAPVVIGNGASGDPDTITVLQSRVPGFSVPMVVSENHPQNGTYFVVKSSLGATDGAMMIAVPQLQSPTSWCTLFNATNTAGDVTTTLGTTRVPHVGGTTGKWNQSAVFPTTGYPAGSYLLNMGTMVYRTYSISSTNGLAVAERSPVTGADGSPQDLYPQIVNLQAMYGKDTDGDGVVDTYDTTTPLTNADWQRVLAIRVAVVARSNQYEKEEVTATAPLWNVGALGAASNVTGITACSDGTVSCLPIKVSQVADWKHYRYKVYDTVVPLRNVLWNS